MSYRSSLLNGEGIPPHRHRQHLEAWEHKKNGRYRQAQTIWQRLLDTESTAMSLRELAATLQQMGVVSRGLWQLRRADGHFQIAGVYAEKAGDPDLLRAIALDHTTVLLDQFRPRRAVVKIEEVLRQTDEMHPQYGQVQSYLGRSYGRIVGRWNRRKARFRLSQALQYLDIDNREQRLDTLIWALEIPFLGRNRRADRDAALQIIAADESLAGRAIDVRITYVGFWPLRHAARWTAAMKRLFVG